MKPMGDGGGGFVQTGNTYDTLEEAVAALSKKKELEAWLLTLTPAERAEWFKANSDANGKVNVDELE
jgi:hypothetical protein